MLLNHFPQKPIDNNASGFSKCNGMLQKKTDRGGGAEGTCFWKRPLEILDFSLYPCKLQTKWSFNSRNSTELCYTHWDFQDQKPRPMEFLHDFFWITPGNSTSFFVYSWNFRILSLEIPCPQTSCLDFFWDSPILKLDLPSRKGSKKLTIFLIP